MIETVENIVQVSVLLVCACISAVWAVRERGGSAILLFLFYASYALADLYLTLYLVFYQRTPTIFISDFSWYAAYLFLYLMMVRLPDPVERSYRPAVLWLLPAFCVGMCVFYMQWGDYPGNVICAVMMSLLLFRSIRGLLYARAHPGKASGRSLCLAVLLFCILEYALWTASCFWSGDTWRNPYFLLDCLMTVWGILLLPAYRKAVKA